ncbi:MAG: cytidylate kinase-like family protein [Thermodesulfobacteriota bacterium]
MAARSEASKYVPGIYPKSGPDAAEMAAKYVREWDQKRLEIAGAKGKDLYWPAICFSREVGVGAPEIAATLAERIGYRVVDRQILEYIAGQARLSEKTAAFFDERYPGKLAEFLSMAFGEKAFTKSEYTRHLFTAVITIAGLGPALFVGRGAHLLAPRNLHLAVRFIASREHRIRRLAAGLSLPESEAAGKLDEMERERRAFYKAVYGKKELSPHEFDLVINCDYLGGPGCAADIVERAFREKFPGRLK